MNDAPSSSSSDRHSRFELRTLMETARMLAESHNLEFILNNLLLIAMGKLMVARGLILLYQPARKTYRVAKAKGKNVIPEDDIITLPDPRRIQQQSVITCAPGANDMPTLIDEDTNCTLFNLRTRSRHIGFLCLGSRGNHEPLRSHEIEFIESLVTISSVAIANSRMVTELKKTNRSLDRKVYELNTLLDLSKDFNRMVDRGEIIRVFKFAMLGQMLIRNFFFVLQQDGNRSMVATNSINGSLSKAEINRLYTMEDEIIPVDDALAAAMPFLAKNNIKALIGLYFQDQKIALVGIGGRANKEPYTESDFNFLQSLGNLAVLSIQKTLLLEERIEKERLEEELNIAKNIQQGLLPNPIPSHPRLDIAAQNVPSQQVGGDYFDVLVTPDDRLLFAIADVTGKGTPAALLMANLQAMLHVLLPVDIPLSEATARINDMIYQNSPADKFVTFFWGILSPDEPSFRYVNAGHNPPLLFREGREECEEMSEGGLILGAMPTMGRYEEVTLALQTGDLLVFYTDGITEAMDRSQSEEYGEERLTACIRNHREQSAEDIITAIIDDVNDFAEDIQYDDITLIVINVRPAN